MKREYRVYLEEVWESGEFIAYDYGIYYLSDETIKNSPETPNMPENHILPRHRGSFNDIQPHGRIMKRRKWSQEQTKEEAIKEAKEWFKRIQVNKKPTWVELGIIEDEIVWS